MDVLTVIAAIQAVGAQIPAFVALIDELKMTMSASDQSQIDTAMNASALAADAQHQEAQGL